MKKTTKRKAIPRPVLAWCTILYDDKIRPTRCFTFRETARAWGGVSGQARIIRVEIRPAPKRKSKMTKPMTHQPLTKAEREELRRLHEAATPGPWETRQAFGPGNWALWASAGDDTQVRIAASASPRDAKITVAARNALPRLLDALDADERKIYELKSRICGLDCRYTMGDVADISGSHCTQPCARCLADRDLTEVEAQRDRAESDLDAERKMRVEAEAKLDEREGDMHARIRAGYDTMVADSWRAKVAEVEAERDALKAKLTDLEQDRKGLVDLLHREGYQRCDAMHCNCGSWHAHGGWRARFREIQEVVEDAGQSMNGATLVKCVQAIIEDRDAAKSKLAALVEAAHRSVLIAKDESRGGPCAQAEPGLTINAEVRRRMKSIRALLTPAIAAAKGEA